MTCAELQAMEPADVLAMDKADIVASIFEGVIRSTAANEYDGKQLTGQIQTTTDAYDKLIGTVEIGLSYQTTGEVNEITITLKDENGKVTDSYKIKHPLDGQPYIVENGQKSK